MANNTAVCQLTDATRTKDSARECKCDECKAWWCRNVPGYFLCPICREVRLLHSDGPFDGMCEFCFDELE